MSKSLQEIIAGLGCVIAIAVIFFYATWGGAAVGIEGYKLRAQYERIDGLIIGSEVRLAGVVIGEVERIRYLADVDRAEVLLKMRNGFQIPVDSIAGIHSDNLFSEKFIRIDPGGSEEMLPAGGQFTYVQNSIDLIGVFQKLVENAEQRLGLTGSSERTGQFDLSK